jgi:putative membrane protein
MKITKDQLILGLKGFGMGMADIVPGVSGGTIALITGVYDNLIKSISSINKDFFKLVLSFKIKEALNHLNISFLLPLLLGIALAFITMSRVMHYFMNEYSIYTWSLFFGLILASILFIGKTIQNLKSFNSLALICVGTIIGYAIVSLVPVDTPNSLPMVFLSGSIAICAMILPGISGSFILLILGKYLYMTSALKNPMVDGNIFLILTFMGGCLVGILAFSKVLNHLLKNFHNQTMCILLGFMIGSMKKIWPWKEIIETKIVRGKTHILKDVVVMPSEINSEVIIALALMIFGILLVLSIEKFSKKTYKPR